MPHAPTLRCPIIGAPTIRETTRTDSRALLMRKSSARLPPDSEDFLHEQRRPGQWKIPSLTFETREQAALGLFDYIETFCSRVRTRSTLGYLSPEEFEPSNWPEQKGRAEAA